MYSMASITAGIIRTLDDRTHDNDATLFSRSIGRALE